MEVFLYSLLCVSSFCILGIISCVLWGALINFLINQIKKSSREKPRYIPSNKDSSGTPYSSNGSSSYDSHPHEGLTDEQLYLLAREQTSKEREEDKRNLEIYEDEQRDKAQREEEESLRQQEEMESREREREEEEREYWEEKKRQRYEDE